MERLSLKKLHDVEDKQQYGVIILNRLIVLESVGDDVGRGKILERISKYQSKRAEITAN
jgi:hypothetical protein